MYNFEVFSAITLGEAQSCIEHTDRYGIILIQPKFAQTQRSKM